MDIEYHDEIQNYHGFKIFESWSRGKSLLNIVGGSHEITPSFMRNLSEEDMVASTSIGVMHHLTERAYEQLLGAITCFSTKNAASSEVLSRVVIESCVNILFMLNKDPDSALFSWFKRSIEQDKRQIDDWEKSLDSLGTLEKQHHEPRIKVRRELNLARGKMINEWIDEVSKIRNLDDTFRWPSKVLKLFSEVGELTTYHTVYARLSSQTHCDAEDTINLISATVVEDENLQLKMSMETVAFSEYMLFMAAMFYLKAINEFHLKFSGSKSDQVEIYQQAIVDDMHKIAKEWGW